VYCAYFAAMAACVTFSPRRLSTSEVHPPATDSRDIALFDRLCPGGGRALEADPSVAPGNAHNWTPCSSMPVATPDDGNP